MTLPNVHLGDPHVDAHNAERDAYNAMLDLLNAKYSFPTDGIPESDLDADLQAKIDAAAGIGTPVSVPSPAPADGTLLAYSTALGKYVPVAPTGSAQLASASNKTGTVTAVTSTGGLGAVTLITGVNITVPDTGGRPLALHWGCGCAQSVAGTGTMFLTVQETTSGSVNVGSAINKLPNVAAADAANADFSMLGQADVGVVAGVRTFRLFAQLYVPAANSPNVNIQNSTGFPTFLRAVAG